jgi:hypoxia up-regulated 1
MLLGHARDQAAEMAGERIKDVVITVPPYLTQTERQAVLDAADLAGLHVLRLLNAETAVALHYGITRKFNATPEYHIFYDMGAASTKVSAS